MVAIFLDLSGRATTAALAARFEPLATPFHFPSFLHPFTVFGTLSSFSVSQFNTTTLEAITFTFLTTLLEASALPTFLAHARHLFA